MVIVCYPIYCFDPLTLPSCGCCNIDIKIPVCNVLKYLNHKKNSLLVFQIIELGVSEKDIEKEHFAQLRRWKETHGDLHCKSPPRMHGAKAIITAEPPSRQDLKQRPTIIVHSPLATQPDGEREQDAKESAKTNKGKQKKTTLPPVETVNPYLSPSDPSPLLKHMTVQGSKESLSSAEHDTYL